MDLGSGSAEDGTLSTGAIRSIDTGVFVGNVLSAVSSVLISDTGVYEVVTGELVTS